MDTKVTRRQIRQNRQAFLRASAEAGDDGSVCGFHDENGTPHYFVVPKAADEVTVRARAFETINGRPMNRAEQLLDAAAAGDFIAAYEKVMTHYLDRGEQVAAD